MPDVDDPIAAMIAATNREDSAGFLAAFADDAVLDDWGREFRGTAEIARWDASENIGVHSRIRALGVTRDGDVVTVAVQVTGDGYNGGGSMAFTLRDGLIATMRIRG